MTDASTDPKLEWTSKRRQVAYQELRSVLEAQQSVIADIDDKAARTVRITALLIGIVVSAAGLAEVAFQPALAFCGGVALVLSIGFGVFTYSESDVILGPTGEYAISLAVDEMGEIGWEVDLLIELASWTDQNAADIEYNGRLLFRTQALLVVGIVSVALAVVFYPARAYIGI